MRMTEIDFSGGTPVDGYGPGFFRIGGRIHSGATAVLPGQVLNWAGLDDPAPFLGAAAEIDVLFVGTGAEIAHIPAAFRRKVEEAGMGVEIMASDAACRTYNVLLSEGRRVGLALLPL